VLAARREIETIGINDEEGRVLVVEEEMVEGIVQAAQILLRDPLFVAPPAPADPVEKDARRRLEIDDEIGIHDFPPELFEESVVEHELVVLENDVGENAVLGEEIVGDDELGKEIALRDVALLPEAVQEEEKLRLERVSFPIVVEFRDKRIVVHFLQKEGGGGLLREEPRERRFPRSDVPLDRDEANSVRGEPGLEIFHAFTLLENRPPVNLIPTILFSRSSADPRN